MASSLFEIAFGSIVAISFGLFSLYLIFEKQIKSTILYNDFKISYNNNPIKWQRIPFIFTLVIMEILFYLYTPENFVINGIRILLMILFFIGILLFLLQIISVEYRRRQ